MPFRTCKVSSKRAERAADRMDDVRFAEECLISNDPGKYHYVAQGMLTIDNVDDAEEMRITDEAFDILGFNKVRLIGQKSEKANVRSSHRFRKKS